MSLIRLDLRDDVGVAVQAIAPGTIVAAPGEIGDRRIVIKASIPVGHKVALRALTVGEIVYKYGSPIGRATRNLSPGDHVHSHNLSGERIETTGSIVKESSSSQPGDFVAPSIHFIDEPTFLGYMQADGRVGTRNTVAIISSVNCSATVARRIAAHFTKERLANFPHIDAVVAYTHGTGCGLGEGSITHQMLARTLGGIMRHPNVGGRLLVGLGCEQATTGDLVERDRLVQINQSCDPAPTVRNGGVPTITMQEAGGTNATVAAGIRLVEQLLPSVNEARRERVSARHLLVGLECGGSDAWSGITANPAVGTAADRIVAAGGGVILSETPEIYGAEHLLTRRAVTPQVAADLMERIRWWEGYTTRDGVTMDNNPSTGNKAGGLTTIAEKSLGAVAKGGSSPLVAVVPYSASVTWPGLTFMDTPGYDPASVTGMMAGGATVILFTTGRGSCFGSQPAPTIKIATNTLMFDRMREDMDLDAGSILTGVPVANVGQQIFEAVLRVASGETTRSESYGLGENEFVPWTVGPTL